MPNSPGSMVNQYRLDEDDVERHLGVRDLFITVDKPESHITTIETFITYRVVTKVGTWRCSRVLLCRRKNFTAHSAPWFRTKSHVFAVQVRHDVKRPADAAGSVLSGV